MSFVKHGFRVPAGFTFGLGSGSGLARFKNFGLGYPKILEKQLGRARARARAEARPTTTIYAESSYQRETPWNRWPKLRKYLSALSAQGLIQFRCPPRGSLGLFYCPLKNRRKVKPISLILQSLYSDIANYRTPLVVVNFQQREVLLCRGEYSF